MLWPSAKSFVVSFALVVAGFAQGFAGPNTIELTLMVTYASGTAVAPGTEVILTNQAGLPSHTATAAEGVARFQVPPGDYQVKVRVGQNFTEARFSIMPGESVHTEHLTVRPGPSGFAEPTVSLAQLQIPAPARKEFQKGMKELRAGRIEKAEARFHKALACFSQYAAALNALGVAATQRKNNAQAENYFRDAITADAHELAPRMNLSRLLFQRGLFAEAKLHLQHALVIRPNEAEALSLLAYAELGLREFDSAIALTKRIHGSQHERFAMVHFIAARAYAAKGLHNDATSEYEVYLRESPTGPSAAQARAALQSIHASLR
jgi:tetratricopeptide (TPR) repeat protein